MLRKSLVTLLILSAGICLGQNQIFVSTSGNDSTGDGSISNPYNTIKKAGDQANPGDTVFVRAGTYQNADFGDNDIWTGEPVARLSYINGSVDNFITFMPYQNEVVIIEFDGIYGFLIQNASYIKIQGFVFDGIADNITQQQAEDAWGLYKDVYGNIHDLEAEMGINITDPSIIGTSIDQPNSSDNTIEKPIEYNGRALVANKSHHIELIGNTIRNVPSAAIRAQQCDYITITNNTVYNNTFWTTQGVGAITVSESTVRPDGDTFTGTKISISQNKVYQNENRLISWNPSKTFVHFEIDEGTGIFLTRNKETYTQGEMLIANNLSYKNGASGIVCHQTNDVTIAHNTVFDNGTTNHGIPGGIGVNASDNVNISSNISYSKSNKWALGILAEPVTNLTLESNIVYNNSGSIDVIRSTSSNSITTGFNEIDPLFVDADDANFNLQKTSPAIDNASSQSGQTTDYFGNDRDASPDIGAIEHTAADSTVIIIEGSTWKYLDDGSDQGTSWYLSNYDDTPWNEGVSEFGYGDNDESTVVSFGSDASNKHITTYFRKSFNIENPDVYNDLTLEAIRDDGIVVYLNGTKVWQDNMPENFDYQTPATSGIGGDDETEWISTVIDNSLVEGVNIIAVEIHQSSSSSSDMSFDFKLIGGVNDAPVAQNMSVNVVENSSVDFNLSAVDEDGDEVSFSVGTAENGSTSIYGTTVTYKPQENFSGSDTFTYTASDGKLQTTASVTITVVDPVPTSVLLEKVQKDVLKYFWDKAHPISKLTKERIHVNNLELHKDMVTAGGSGFGFLNVIMGIENGWIEKEEGLTHFETALDFLENADRFHGAWPHWMEGDTGNVWAFSDLDDGGDLVETAFLVQGLICVREYFKNGTDRERDIADQADELWRGVEWDWYTKGEDKLYWHWSPNHEWAINLRVSGYNEAMITYILAAASPTHTINADVYHKGWAGVDQYFPEGWIKTDAEKYGLPIFLKHGGANGSVGPMFLSHYSNLVLDPRNLKDDYVDNYFDVVKNHTAIIYQHCVENPSSYEGYSENVWGLTASYSYDPDKEEMTGYHVHQPDDDLGVITPTAALSSLPYTPEESIKFLRYLYEGSNNDYLSLAGPIDAFSIHHQWRPERHLAIDQGTIGPMIENYKTQLFWNLFMNAPDIREGLSKLGFTSSQHNLLNTAEIEEKTHPFFPNPTTSKIFIDAEFSYVKLYDLTGKEVIKSTSKHIDLSQLSNNVYILRLYDDSNNVFQTSKVIKE